MSSVLHSVAWAACIAAVAFSFSQCQQKRDAQYTELQRAKLEACVKLDTCKITNTNINVDTGGYR